MIFKKNPRQNIENQKSLNIPKEIANLKKKEIVALIAYLQRLGKDISNKKN